MEYQYQFSLYPEFRSSNTANPRSYYFTSDGVSGLVFNFGFNSAISEHHNSLVGTEGFSFFINLVLHKYFFAKATQLYFLTAPSTVSRFYQGIIQAREYRTVQDKTFAFEVRDTASPGLDREHSKLARRQLISCKVVFKLNVIGRLKS